MSDISEGGSSGVPAGTSMPQRATAESFERLYAASSDPWDYDSSPYEREKYTATLAALDGRLL